MTLPRGEASRRAAISPSSTRCRTVRAISPRGRSRATAEFVRRDRAPSEAPAERGGEAARLGRRRRRGPHDVRRALHARVACRGVARADARSSRSRHGARVRRHVLQEQRRVRPRGRRPPRRPIADFLTPLVPDGASRPRVGRCDSAAALGRLRRASFASVLVSDGVASAGLRAARRASPTRCATRRRGRAAVLAVPVGSDADESTLAEIARGGGGVVVPYAPGRARRGRGARASLVAGAGALLRDVERRAPRRALRHGPDGALDDARGRRDVRGREDARELARARATSSSAETRAASRSRRATRST